MATGVGRGRIQSSVNSPTQKTHIIRKDLEDISYINRVIACFVLIFVAMTTRVGRCKIWLTSFDSPIQKNPCQTQIYHRYLFYKPSFSQFCLKFRCHGNGGWSW